MILIITKIVLWVIKKSIFRKSGPDQFSKRNSYSLFQLIKYIIWVIALGIILETIGVKVSLLLAGSAALLVGIGLGLQQTFNDVISGVILLSERSIRISDILEIDDKILKISISNDFDPKIIDKIETALKEVKTNWEENRDDYSKINIEGGSGFDKIRRILAVDMQMKNCDFDYEIKRNNLNISISLEISIYQTEK